MSRLKTLLTLGLGLVCGSVASGQQRPLADVEALSYDSTANRLSYEQRLSRNPMRAMWQLTQFRQQTGEGNPRKPELMPLFQGVPVAAYGLDEAVQTRLLSASDRKAFATATPFDARKYLLDFRLLPEFSAIFGYREKVVETKTNLLLQSQWLLRRGLVLNWGVLFPVVNNWDNQARNIRPAPIFLNQFLALGKADFMSISAGLFYNDRYGFNMQYRRSDLTRPWSFGLEAGLTGFYFYPPDNIYYEPLRELLLLGDAAYRLEAYDITLKLTAGQFLYHDRGARVDFIRQLGNVEVGFFVQKTGNGTTGGFNFAMPLLPKAIARAGAVRLRAAEEFRWEYNYSRGYRIGERYKTGYQLDALLRQYHQSYLTNQYRATSRR